MSNSDSNDARSDPINAINAATDRLGSLLQQLQATPADRQNKQYYQDMIRAVTESQESLKSCRDLEKKLLEERKNQKDRPVISPASIPANASSENFDDVWNCTRTKITIWGEKRVLGLFRKGNFRLDRHKPRVNDTYAASIRGLALALYPLFEEYELPLSPDVWIMQVSDDRYSKKTEELSDDPEFRDAAETPCKMTAARIQVYLAVLADYLREQNEDWILTPVLGICARSRTGGLCVISSSEKLTAGTSLPVWMCSEDAYAEEESTRFEDWQFGTSWSGLGQESDMRKLDEAEQSKRYRWMEYLLEESFITAVRDTPADKPVKPKVLPLIDQMGELHKEKVKAKRANEKAAREAEREAEREVERQEERQEEHQEAYEGGHDDAQERPSNTSSRTTRNKTAAQSTAPISQPQVLSGSSTAPASGTTLPAASTSQDYPSTLQTALPIGSIVKAIPDGKDIDVSASHGAGMKIYVGKPGSEVEVNKDHFSAAAQKYLTTSNKRPKADRRDYTFYRSQCVEKNEDELERCMATYKAGGYKPGVDKEWTDKDGPCNACKQLGRQCFVMLSLDLAWYKGIATKSMKETDGENQEVEGDDADNDGPEGEEQED